MGRRGRNAGYPHSTPLVQQTIIGKDLTNMKFLPVDQGMLQDELFSTIHTDRGVTESKLALLTT